MSEQQDLFTRFEGLYWQVYRDTSMIWKKIFEQHLPSSQVHILFMLEKSGPKRMSEVSDILHLTPEAVTIASDKLLDHGYITRIRDEKDRRAMKIVFGHLSNDEIEHLIQIFNQAPEQINNLRWEYDE